MASSSLPNGHGHGHGHGHDTDNDDVETYDVLIVGAGVSGINTAYRLQTERPGTTFTLLEGRANLGGTWDLFRYPGIRSDSDLYTYGFQWEPWPYQTPIAKGPLIKEYLENCVAKYNLGRHMRFHHKVVAADWSRDTEKWTVTVQQQQQQKKKKHGEGEGEGEEGGETKKIIRATWLVLGTGYYDYEKPLETSIPGLADFEGKLIHPQYWPEDYDHSGKKMVIIGSGATAISLVPALAETAAAVTMVQRSPSYIFPASNSSPATSLLIRWLPKSLTAPYFRATYLWKMYSMVLLSRYFPQAARRLVLALTAPLLPARIPLAPHFSPSYTPWQQRLCLSPDGDFFQSLREHEHASVVTGHIDRVVADGLRMRDGTVVEADAIVTATGLQMRMGGNVRLTVNGDRVDWAGRLVWRGTMIQDVPNMTFVVGYVDASWTLGADAAVNILTRLMDYMKSKGVSTAVPRVPPEGTGGTRRFWNLTSTYSERAEKTLPKYGNTGPWRPKMNPPLDWIHGRWGDIVTGIHFSP